MPTRGAQVSCWACAKVTDAATAVIGEDTVPQAGDLSICFGCGEFAIFTGDDLATRQPSDAERTELLADPDAVRARGAVLAHIAIDH